MAIISVAALTSTISVQRQFVFLNNFKEILNKVREARADAVTQKSVELTPADATENPGIPSSYGVHIKKNENQITVTVFADLTTSSTQNGFDDSESLLPDLVIGQPYSFDATKYNLTIFDDTATNLQTDPPALNINAGDTLTLLYSPIEIKVVATGYDLELQTNHPFPGSYISLKLADSKVPTLTKNITLFLRSGIAESIQNLPVTP